MEKNRRQLKHLLINPDAQIRFGTLFLSILLVFHLVVTILGIELYLAWASRSDDTTGVRLLFAFGGIAVIYIVFYLLAFAMGIIISHKIYGPFVNINRMLERFISGDFSARIHLRKGDDKKVDELAQRINRLVDTIAVKKP